MGISGSSSAGAYAVPVSSPSASNSAIYRNATSTAQLATTLDGVHTLYDNFLCGVHSSTGSGEGPCLGERDGKTYKWLSYNTVLERAKFIGSALQGAYKHAPQTMVGLFSQNSAAWVLVEQACNAYSLISVPLYDTLGPDAAEYIINSTEMRTIACTKDKTKSLLALASKCPSLSLIIELDSPAGATLQRGSIEIISLPSLELIGKLNPKAPVPPRPSDLATIVFTSGTTDMPKGVMLTHGNFAAAGAGAASSGVDLYNTDVHISYLPLAHVFERIVQTCIFHRGAAVGFFSGDVQKLLEDMAVLRPTIFPSVPRLFNRCVHWRTNVIFMISTFFPCHLCAHVNVTFMFSSFAVCMTR
jgi:long-chain acyl-CoA synthetase